MLLDVFLFVCLCVVVFFLCVCVCVRACVRACVCVCVFARLFVVAALFVYFVFVLFFASNLSLPRGSYFGLLFTDEKQNNAV